MSSNQQSRTSARWLIGLFVVTVLTTRRVDVWPAVNVQLNNRTDIVLREDLEAVISSFVGFERRLSCSRDDIPRSASVAHSREDPIPMECILLVRFIGERKEKSIG
jgi:uncharacterized protein YlzI (FlbEa/FlbD family)